MTEMYPLPYYAVIFTSKHGKNLNGYITAATYIEELAKEQPGFLGLDSARSELGITVSYWKDLNSIKAWKEHQEHVEVQKKGKNQWYSSYSVRIAKVEFSYNFES